MAVDASKRDMGEVVHVRPYVSADRDQCVAIAVDAWPTMSSNLPRGIAPDFWGTLIDMTWAYSDVHEVACSSDSVVGLLFGRLHGSLSARETIRLAKILLSSIWAISRKLPLKESISIVSRNLLTEIKVLFNSPSSDGEIAFLAVDPRFQGMGIGDCLLDRFITRARAAGVRSMSVYTTDPGCNWRFYERRGFRRVAQFGDDFGTRIEGRMSTGMIYVLELRE